MNQSSQAEQFERLWTDFLEGELGEADTQQLRDLLAADENLRRDAVELYQTHRLLGLLFAEEDRQQQQFVTETLQQIRHSRQEFSHQAMQRIRHQASTSPRPTSVTKSVSSPPPTPEARQWTPEYRGRLWLSLAGLLLLGSTVWLMQPRPSTQELAVTPQNGSNEQSPLADLPAARFQRFAKARFFGELTPAVHSATDSEKRYILTSGMVELLFPGGAQAIIEGPATFRTRPGNCLEMLLGRCSVYAPDGAEGFRVETPDTRVVDRGTRFTIDVSEDLATEIQVVEGLADVYQQIDPIVSAPTERQTSPHSSATTTPQREPNFESSQQEVRLSRHQAVRVVSGSQRAVEPGVFNGGKHRRHLPDRIVSYTASAAESDGLAEHLETVTVQRNDREIVYQVSELIPVELIWYRAPNNTGRLDHTLGGPELVGQPELSLTDHSLVTGVINPGGDRTPLQHPPVLEHLPEQSIQGTPGLAIRFRQPVRNGPGPDVVFFEIHPVPNPTDGDAFHVSPLPFVAGRTSLTVNEYDLSLYSPEALPVTRMLVHETPGQRMETLDDLRTADVIIRPVRLDYRALAVGIDLSDLGVPEGESVTGLFIQDAADGEGQVDPVFIGGLPFPEQTSPTAP